MKRDARLMLVLDARQIVGHKCRGIAAGHRARREPPRARGDLVDPVDPEGAPVVAVTVPGHQIPTAAEVHERVGLSVAAALLAVAGAVGEAELLVVPARAGDRRQRLGVHLGAFRSTRQRDGMRAQCVHPSAQTRREHLLELDQRSHRGLLYTGDRGSGRSSQPDRDGHRLVVVEQKRRHGRARLQPVAAIGAGWWPARGNRARAGARCRGARCVRISPGGRQVRRPPSHAGSEAGRAA